MLDKVEPQAPGQSRPRALFLSARVPFPLDSGAKLRTFYLLKGLSGQYEVTLLTLSSGDQADRYPQELTAICHDIVVVHHPRIDRNPPILLLDSLAQRIPFTVLKYRSALYRKTLRQLLQQDDFDLVHCDHLQMSQYLDEAPSTRKVFDAHNIEAQLWQRQTESVHGLKRAIFAWQQRLVRSFEQAAWERVDCVITCSENDRRWIADNSQQGNAIVVPNGVDIAHHAEADSQAIEANSLVFVGSMDWPPNDQGVLYFLRTIWPALKRRRPELRFYVVGRRPSREVKSHAEGDPQVIVTGAVDDVRPHVARAAVYVVPLYVGGGTRLKILEAFALNKAVVSTKLGAEGIDCSHDEDILLADDDAHFADLVIELLDDSVRATRLGEAGYRLAAERYDWNAIGARYAQHAGGDAVP